MPKRMPKTTAGKKAAMAEMMDGPKISKMRGGAKPKAMMGKAGRRGKSKR